MRQTKKKKEKRMEEKGEKGAGREEKRVNMIFPQRTKGKKMK
jgi:hypothetical protein